MPDHSCGPTAGRVNQARFAITFSSHKSLSQGHGLAGDNIPDVHKNLERRWVTLVPWLLTCWSSFCSLCGDCRKGLCSSCLHAFMPERTLDIQIFDVLLVAPLTYATTADAVIHADFVEHPVTSTPTKNNKGCQTEGPVSPAHVTRY